MSLETENAFYLKHKEEYRKEWYDKFLVISGEKLWGVFADESVAVDFAVEQFPVENFMIHSPAWEDEECSVLLPLVVTRRRQNSIIAGV